MENTAYTWACYFNHTDHYCAVGKRAVKTNEDRRKMKGESSAPRGHLLRGSKVKRRDRGKEMFVMRVVQNNMHGQREETREEIKHSSKTFIFLYSNVSVNCKNLKVS